MYLMLEEKIQDWTKVMSLSWDEWHSLTEDKYVLSVPEMKFNMINRETAWSDRIIFFSSPMWTI